MANAPKSTSPTAKSAQAADERAAGTLGTRLGTNTPTRLTVTITATLAATSPSRNGIERRAFSRGTPERASTAAPTGSVAPPVRAITPLLPTSTPGVTRPCTASSTAMTVKPPPTRTVRASPRLAPTDISRSARTAAASALTPTP